MLVTVKVTAREVVQSIVKENLPKSSMVEVTEVKVTSGPGPLNLDASFIEITYDLNPNRR